jgi:PilZ domain
MFIAGVSVMPSEQRKSSRKSIAAKGFLYGADGQAIGPCQVENVSVGGAMLAPSSGNELPAQFVLSLSRNGQVRRHCQITWRARGRFGVRFVAPDPE